MIRLMVEDLLKVVEVNSFVSEEEMKEISRLVKSAEKWKGIQFVRDEVVRYTSEMKMNCRAKGDWEGFDQYNNVMSKIVAVIDMVREA